ncbi:MAG: GDYXXLXY domain-containing protein [Methylocystis sp.]
MISKARLWLFAAMALLQLAVPAGMILSRERTLAQGEAFKFRTAPVDPYDAFRGRYVSLRIENAEAAWPQAKAPAYGQTVYARIETGDDGFARFGLASLSRPKGKPYLTVQAGVANEKGGINLQLPFDRFYMKETKAPAAEKAYREHNRRGAQDAYVVLRVRDGDGVIENLFVGGKPIAAVAAEAKP